MAVSIFPALVFVSVLFITVEGLSSPIFPGGTLGEKMDDFNIRSSPSENSVLFMKRSMLNFEENPLRDDLFGAVKDIPPGSVIRLPSPRSEGERYLIPLSSKRNGKTIQKFVLVDVVDFISSPKELLEMDGIPTVVVPAKAGESSVSGDITRVSGK